MILLGRKSGLLSMIQFSLCLMFGLLALPVDQSMALPEVKIGYVDLEKAISSSKAGASAKKEMEIEFKKIQDALEKQKNEVTELQGKYDKQSKSLNKEAREKKMEELLSMEKGLQRSVQDSKEALKRKEAKLIEGLVEQLREVIKDLGEDDEYTIILERRPDAVLYADKSIDITEEVISRFNKK